MEREEMLDVLFDNLYDFAASADTLCEQRRLTISHISLLLCQSSIIDEAFFARCTSLCQALGGDEAVFFLRELYRDHRIAAKMKQDVHIGSKSSVVAGAHGRCAFVKNELNSAAFDALSRRIMRAKPVYVSSFSAACESVIDGESEFCILPLENSTDGKLLNFYALIDRYDLKISAVCDIECDDPPQTVRYALLCRSVREPSEREKGSPFVLELSIPAEDASFLCRLLCAAQECDATLLTMNFMPVHYDTYLRRYLFGFRVSGRASVFLRLFALGNYQNYTPLGLYPYVEG